MEQENNEMMRIANEKRGELLACGKAFPGYVVHINDWWWGKTFTIAHENGIGIVELQLDDSYPSVAFIKGLSVWPDNRHHGIGAELMSVCEKIAKHEGYKFLQLSVIHTGSWLPEWYRRLGFSVFMKDEHEFVMMKCIEAI